jgi:hypothetical protein
MVLRFGGFTQWAFRYFVEYLICGPIPVVYTGHTLSLASVACPTLWHRHFSTGHLLTAYLLNVVQSRLRCIRVLFSVLACIYWAPWLRACLRSLLHQECPSVLLESLLVPYTHSMHLGESDAVIMEIFDDVE